MAGLIGGLFSAIPEVMKAVESGSDADLANQYASVGRPQFKTPPSVFKAYKRLQMLKGLPGKGYIEEDIDAATGHGVRALKETSRASDIPSSIAALYGKNIDANRALGVQEAGLARENQMDLADFETGVLAPYQEKEFDINEFQPYQNAQKAAAALFSSSEQNAFGSAEGFASIGTTLASMFGEGIGKRRQQKGDNTGYTPDMGGFDQFGLG